MGGKQAGNLLAAHFFCLQNFDTIYKKFAFACVMTNILLATNM